MEKKPGNRSTGLDRDFDDASNEIEIDETQAQKKGLVDKAGNAIEKIGHKVAEAGAPKLGQRIHDAGDKMEKSHRNPRHPHNV